MKRILLAFIFASPGLLFGQDTLKISLLFTGDIMQHESQIFAAFNPDSNRYDYKPCFQFVKPVLSAPEIIDDCRRQDGHLAPDAFPSTYPQGQAGPRRQGFWDLTRSR